MLFDVEYKVVRYNILYHSLIISKFFTQQKNKCVFNIMAEGTFSVTRELLSLEPTAMVELFIIIPNSNSNSTKDHVYIHNGSVYGGSIIFNNKKYEPVAMDFDGFESKTSARPNRPTLKISNRRYFVSDILQGVADDLRVTEVVRIKTFVRFLDDANFEGNTNPFGPQPNGGDSVVNQKFIVSQKLLENKEFVQVELTTPVDVDSKSINQRRVFAKYCPFEYRGNGCRYAGPPVNQESGRPFSTSAGGLMDLRFTTPSPPYWNSQTNYSVGSVVRLKSARNKLYDDEFIAPNQSLDTFYVARKNNVNKNPADEENKWDNWQKDGCNKTLASCKLRFPTNNKFGGFPGTDGFQFRRGVS